MYPGAVLSSGSTAIASKSPFTANEFMPAIVTPLTVLSILNDVSDNVSAVNVLLRASTPILAKGIIATLFCAVQVA